MNQDHVFIDVGVSHASLDKGEIVGLAAVRTDSKGKVLAAFAEHVRPSQAVLDEDDDLEECKEARVFEKVIGDLKNTILDRYPSTYVVVSHGEVDRRFLRQEWERIGERGEVFTRAWVDTSLLVWPFAYHDMIAARDLNTLCHYFRVENTAPNTVQGDCEALVRVYWAMMKRYKFALLGEEAVRDYGGELLGSFRQWVGL